MMGEKLVQVRTRARTMSGQPGGRTMTLDPATAKEWIDAGWAEPIDKPESEAKPFSRGRSTTAGNVVTG